MQISAKLIQQYVDDILSQMNIETDSEEHKYYIERLKQELNKSIILALIQNLSEMDEQILSDIFSRGDIPGGLQFLIDKNPDFEKISAEALEEYKKRFLEEYKKVSEQN